MVYSDVHKNVAQLLLSAGALPEDDLLEKLKECVAAHAAEAKRARLKVHATDNEKNLALLAAVVKDINAALEPLGVKVGRKRDKHDRLVYYGLANLRFDDKAAAAATPLGRAEQEFFHKLAAAIGAAPARELDAIEAENVRLQLSGGNKLSEAETARCLQRLEESKWLARCGPEDGAGYTLGIRAIIQDDYSVKESGAAGPSAAADGDAPFEAD